MYLTDEFSLTPKQTSALKLFLAQYGPSELEQALQAYADMHQYYICKTKTALSKFKISDIYYLKIQEHSITVHTQHGIYKKYGSLNTELSRLSSYGFMKCNQSCLVSLKKIRSVHLNTITLINNEKLHMSRRYAPKLIIAFSRNN